MNADDDERLAEAGVAEVAADYGGDPVAVAREIALRQLDVRARSKEELRRALAKRQVPQAAADEILERFTEVGLIDDVSFAQAWVVSGERRMRSRAILRQELRQKGVDDETIAVAIADSAVSDREVALQFALRKARSLAELEPQVAYRRLCGALGRRGFPISVVLSVADEVLCDSGEK